MRQKASHYPTSGRGKKTRISSACAFCNCFVHKYGLVSSKDNKPISKKALNSLTQKT